MTAHPKSGLPRPYTCEWCGKTFQPRTTGQRLCSIACREKKHQRTLSAYFQKRNA